MNLLINFILERLSRMGEIPLCNGVASRAPHFYGYCFPLCYRCTFFFILFLLTLMLFYRYQVKIPWYVIMIAMVFMIVDGGLQTFFGIMSTNIRRSITGGMFGFAIGAMVTRIFLYLDTKS